MTWAACTNSVLKYLLPRLEILPRIVRSPVDSCFGTRPSQAPKSRPCLKPAPLPIAATTALEMIGPTPGIVIRRWQLSSCSARASISVDTLSIRASSRRQSCARSEAHHPWREHVRVRAEDIWQRPTQGHHALPHRDAALDQKAADLIDH